MKFGCGTFTLATFNKLRFAKGHQYQKVEKHSADKNMRKNERNRNHKQKLNRFISDYHLIDAVARNLNAICGRTAHWIPNEVSASIEVQVYIYTWRVVLLFWLVLAQNINHLVFCV
jgi:hypothetical protein